MVTVDGILYPMFRVAGWMLAAGLAARGAIRPSSAGKDER